LIDKIPPNNNPSVIKGLNAGNSWPFLKFKIFDEAKLFFGTGLALTSLVVGIEEN